MYCSEQGKTEKRDPRATLRYGKAPGERGAPGFLDFYPALQIEIEGLTCRSQSQDSS